MGKIVVLGCGYVGRALVRRLVARGSKVSATTTTEANLARLDALGAEPVLLRTDDPSTFGAAFEDAEAVVHLAPPRSDAAIEDETRRIAGACTDRLKVFLYGSTTGAFGSPVAPGEWIDETTPSRNVADHGRRRLDYERGLRAAGLPLRVVRIAGIYGPGRTLRESIERNELVLFEGGPETSRIHVDDLVRLLEAMIGEDAPPLAVACDELPAPTLDVARYTCELLGLPMPEPIGIEDAKRVLSPAALEMRLGGRKCRSLVREALIGDLKYPTYREGVSASV